MKRRGPKPRELQALAEEYFTACAGRPALDENGVPLTDKNGQPLLLDRQPPTPGGLAYALGFVSVEEMEGLTEPEEAVRTVRRALLLCRSWAEQRLFDKDARQGAEFSLKVLYHVGGAETAEAGGGGVIVLPAAEAAAAPEAQ